MAFDVEGEQAVARFGSGKDPAQLNPRVDSSQRFTIDGVDYLAGLE